MIGGTGSRILDTFAASTTTPSILFGNPARVTLNWPVTLPGTNYAATCSVQEGTTTTNTLRVQQIDTVSPTGLTVRVVNDDSNAGHTGTLHCQAVFR